MHRELRNRFDEMNERTIDAAIVIIILLIAIGTIL